jgi:hypothetical protein
VSDYVVAFVPALDGIGEPPLSPGVDVGYFPAASGDELFDPLNGRGELLVLELGVDDYYEFVFAQLSTFFLFLSKRANGLGRSLARRRPGLAKVVHASQAAQIIVPAAGPVNGVGSLVELGVRRSALGVAALRDEIRCGALRKLLLLPIFYLVAIGGKHR